MELEHYHLTNSNKYLKQEYSQSMLKRASESIKE